MGYITTITALENGQVIEFDIHFAAWVCTFLLFIVSLFLIHKMNEYYRKSQDAAVITLKNDLLEKNIVNLQAANERSAILLHDTRHHIRAMDSLAKSKDYAGLTEYLTQLSDAQKDIPPRFQCRNKFVEAIINIKLEEASDIGVCMYCTIDYPGDTAIAPMDISVILSNLIDNAFDACTVQPREKRIVDVIIKPIYGNMSVKVQNAVSENPLLKNPKLKTLKKTSGIHGYGIRSVRQAASKYGGMVTFSYEDGFFCCDVTLCSVYQA
mgnify:CR=1 FL=1